LRIELSFCSAQRGSEESHQELPAVPDLKKVTADAAGFALTPEGMQDLSAAEAAAAGVLPCSSASVVRSDI